MGKGGGGGPQHVTQTSSNLPEYVEPYFKRLLDRAESATRYDYTPYKGERIAEPTPTAGLSESLARSIGQDPKGEAAFDTATSAFSNVIGSPQFTGTNIAATFDPSLTYQTYAAPVEGVMSAYSPETNVSKFANPYLESVLAKTEASARRRFDEAQAKRDADAIGSGAWSGSRGVVPTVMAQRDLDERLDKMGSEARSAAYGQALEAATGQQALAVKARAQALSDAALQQERRIKAAEAADRLGLAGAEKLLAAAPAAQDHAIKRAQILGTVGETERVRDQLQRDLAYQDFINQRDYVKGQLNYMSGILRGTSYSPETEVRKFEPPPSPYAPLLSLGLGAAGLAKLLG